MTIAIIILNWNGRKLLEKFLPSVIKHSNQATLYLADNNSTDDSVAFVEANYPTVKIIQNIENGGYAKGYNVALKQVSEDIFCLLNSDVEVTENWLPPILNYFKTHSATAIIQPKILDYNSKEKFEYAGAAGGFIDKFGYPFCRGRIFNTLENDNGQYDENTTIFWASGACFFIKKDVFNDLNGFDETFFAHMEEIDLCWRAYNKGLITSYVYASKIYHVGGATLHATQPKKTYLNFRNSLFTLTKNASGNLFWLIILRLKLDAIAGLKFLFNLKPLHTLAIIRAHFNYYSHLSRLLKQRKSMVQNKNYYHKTSIVWSYFVNKKKTFKSL